jgi:hypothetical protein
MRPPLQTFLRFLFPSRRAQAASFGKSLGFACPGDRKLALDEAGLEKSAPLIHEKPQRRGDVALHLQRLAAELGAHVDAREGLTGEFNRRGAGHPWRCHGGEGRRQVRDGAPGRRSGRRCADQGVQGYRAQHSVGGCNTTVRGMHCHRRVVDRRVVVAKAY